MRDTIIIWARQFIETFSYSLRRRVRRLIRKVADIILHDLDLMGSIEAAKTSIAFERVHFSQVPEFRTRHALFEHALAMAHGDLYLEFGVYKGDSINRLAILRPEVTFYGFDSFEGLPENWTLGSRKGAFSLNGRLPPCRKNVKLLKGFFEKSLAPFAHENAGKTLAFIHIDCDLYSATKTVLRHLKSMLRVDTIIIFDEYFNYPGWEEGEYKAFTEFASEHAIRFDYIGYIRTGSQVAVRITELEQA